MNYPTEWWLDERIQRAIGGLAKSYEVDALRSDVGSLEHSLREVRSELDGLRTQVESQKDQIADLVGIVDNLTKVASACP